MIHRPAYNISSFPGCVGAKMQAVASADRPLCAFVSAVASLSQGNKLQGTLYGKSDDVIEQYIQDSLLDFDIPEDRLFLWARAINHADAVPPVQIKFFHNLELDTYQTAAIEALSPAGGALALFCGAGKTVTASVGAIHLKRAFQYHPRLWVLCPLNAMPAWQRIAVNLERHFGEIKIISVDSAHKYTSAPPIGGILIIDEMHTLGAKSSRRTKACHTIRAKFDACIGLTGTLTHAGVAQTLSLADLCVPGAALFATQYSAGEYWNCLVKKQLGPRSVTALEKPNGIHRVQFLEWLSNWCHMLSPDSPEVRMAFQLPEQDMHETKLSTPWPKTIELVEQIAHQILDETGELPHAQAVMHRLARYGIEDKLDYLKTLMVPGEPLVLFANYRESLDHAEAMLKELGITYVRVDGDITGKDRAECERKFQSGEVDIFLGQIHAASVSMNLQRASVSLTLDVNWSTIDYAQMLARTCRRGQTEKCHHIDLVSNNFQAAILRRLRLGMDFNAEAVEYQDMKRHTQDAIYAIEHQDANHTFSPTP